MRRAHPPKRRIVRSNDRRRSWSGFPRDDPCLATRAPGGHHGQPSGNRHALLGLLEGSSRHGYDLKRSYDRRFGEVKPIRFGQVYRTLSQLERDGLVEVVGVEAGSGPDPKRYSITPEGVTDLDIWLGEPEEPQPHRQSVLFTKVVVALLSGRSAEHFLDMQRPRHLDTMKALTTARRNAATTQDASLADFQPYRSQGWPGSWRPSRVSGWAWRTSRHGMQISTVNRPSIWLKGPVKVAQKEHRGPTPPPRCPNWCSGKDSRCRVGRSRAAPTP
jgi:DNA-binding PadR family transcriptional regulator